MGRRGDGETGGRGGLPLPKGEGRGEGGTHHSSLITHHSSLQIATAARNVLILRELEDLLPSLSGARVMLLKGLALLPLYPRIGDRRLSDADVLIDPCDLPGVWERLVALGFQAEPVHSEAYDRECYREMAFSRPAGPGVFRLDVHWGLVSVEWFPDAGLPSFDEMWARSRPGLFDQERARVPSPEDNLLHICLHQALHHSFEDEQPYRDITLLLRAAGRDFDWDLFLSLARGSGWRPAIYSALARAQALARAEVPDDPMRQLRPRGWRLWLIDRLTGSGGGPLVGQQASRLLQLALVERAGSALSMISNALYPSGRWLSLRYSADPGRGTLALRGRHFLRLIGLAGRALVQLRPAARGR